jgi:flagellar biosynthesis protein FlhG
MNLAVQTDRPVKTGAMSIAITSGKGGVGKTNVAINLAAALRRKGQRVAVVDADFALGNVDVLLGLTPTWNLGHLLGGDKTLPEVLVTLPTGVQVVPSGSGGRELTTLTSRQLSRLITAIEDMTATHDYLLIDTAAGMSDNVLDVLMLAERVLVVVAPEPTAIVDAYALIKVLTLTDSSKDAGILVNGAEDAEQAANVFRQLDVAATHFLQRRLRYYGYVSHDDAVGDAVLAQRPVVEHRPQAEASLCFQRLAVKFIQPAAPAAKGILMFPPRPAITGPAQRPDNEGPLCA